MGRSIVNPQHKRYRKKRTRKKSKPGMGAYKKRNRLLRSIGFESYPEYLRSHIWKYVREQVMKHYKGRCWKCDGRATEVHHTKYTERNLLGVDIRGVVAVCRACHKDAEFKAGEKTSNTEANRRLEAFGGKAGMRMSFRDFKYQRKLKGHRNSDERRRAKARKRAGRDAKETG